MANYNEQRIFQELGKLTPDEMFQSLQRITEFVKNELTLQEQEAEEKRKETAAKIQKLSGN